MIISKVLFKGKVLATGEYPIMIRISDVKKRKFISTGISCKVENWNKNKQGVGSKDKDYKKKNEKIEAAYILYTTRQRILDDLSIEYSIEDLLTEPIIGNSQSNSITDFYSIIDEKVRKYKVYNSQKPYLALYRYLKKEVADLPLDIINVEWYRKIVSKMAIKENWSGYMLQKALSSIFNYAVENQYINAKYVKFEGKKIEPIVENKALDKTEFSTILTCYKKEVQAGSFTPSILKYKSNFVNALALYILHINCQGIGNTDLAMLKVKNLNIEKINTIDYDVERALNDEGYQEWYANNNEVVTTIRFNFKRKKSGEKVEVITDYEIVKPYIEVLLIDKEDEDYLLPILDKGAVYTDKQLQKRISNVYEDYTKALNKGIAHFSEVFDLPIIKKNITYYSARFTFINILNRMDVPHHLIRKFIGHRDNVLEKHYIEPLTTLEQVEIMRCIFNTIESIANLSSETK